MSNTAFLEITSSIPHFKSSGPPIKSCIDSDKTFEVARSLLGKCLTEHEGCKQTGTSPTRLLDVSPNRMRLVNTGSLDEPSWAALSYCWGGPQESQTTQTNIHDRFREVIFEELPSTIRDAIHVCRQMHIPYLWVDSLCIIQTTGRRVEGAGESDKDRELPKMGGIFSGAVLTISASCASSVKEGFLQDRLPWPPGVALPVRFNNIYDIAQLVVFPRRYAPEFDEEPVDDRAWTFQEQKLSSRSLNFRTRAMHFECQAMSECIYQDGHNFHTPRIIRFGNTEFAWRVWVKEYTRRDLSDIRDRPIAIAAVAESFANASDTLTFADYAAGLWKPSLLTDLLWYVPCHKSRTINIEGPTWSWTTIPSPVLFRGFTVHDSTATMISIDIVLADPSFVFGATKSGRIRLKGLMTRTSRCLSSSSSDEVVVCHWDRETTCKEVFLLEVTLYREYSCSKRVGLVLKETEKPGVFLRMGYFEESLHAGCESLRSFALRCMVCDRRNGSFWCVCNVPTFGCVGWTCDREQRIIDIV